MFPKVNVSCKVSYKKAHFKIPAFQNPSHLCIIYIKYNILLLL